MNSIAEWVAPIATMIAAMMTAANLGARVTGWGFIVFAFGSIAWTIVGMASGQTNLIATNAFLTLVNVVGIWRWLGREARYADEAVAVAEVSKTVAAPTLTPMNDLIGRPVKDKSGNTIATVVDAMVSCDDGRIGGLLARCGGGVGGVGERIVLLEKNIFELHADDITTSLTTNELSGLPEAREAAETAL